MPRGVAKSYQNDDLLITYVSTVKSLQYIDLEVFVRFSDEKMYLKVIIIM